MVLPELLASIFAGDSLQDCKVVSSSGLHLHHWAYVKHALTLLSSGVLVLELREIVDIVVHDDPEVVGLLVRGHIACGERSRHSCGWYGCCQGTCDDGGAGREV